MIKKLLSLPPNLAGCFHEVTGFGREEWFCTHDPVGRKLGSGGGSTHLLYECFRREKNGDATVNRAAFNAWLASEKRILLHAGGRSRRLPAYAPSGKILTPVPVFRWERGQRLSQNLLALQLPLYERIMEAAPANFHTMIACGDVYVRASKPLQRVPDVDVVCYGLWLPAETATNHGVFILRRETPGTLERMLQKPSVKTLGELIKNHYYLTDIGIWLLSDRAVSLLAARSVRNGELSGYDLYSEFGCALGTSPGIADDELNSLRVAVLPLPGGEFYHFGTSREIISSSLAVQNLVNDQREIIHHAIKPHPSIFLQNSVVEIAVTERNRNLWIENSRVGKGWKISHENIVTGVPENDWTLALAPGDCVDIVPVGESGLVVRPYGYDDKFRGALGDEATKFLGRPFKLWAVERGIAPEKIDGNDDLQSAKIFPLCKNVADAGDALRFMLGEPQHARGATLWRESRKLSADDISNEANLVRLTRKRAETRALNWPMLAKNYAHSVFYQVDLSHAAREFSEFGIAEPAPLADDAPLLTRIHDSMFRAELARLNTAKTAGTKTAGTTASAAGDVAETRAFALLRERLTRDVAAERLRPTMSVCSDQIVWARSPVRIDLAGGWTDTPPYCLMEGGNVVNVAIELNGQPPLQVYVKPSREPKIILRSIDLGAEETVDSYEALADFCCVGSPFSIPKAALALAGFLPEFSIEKHATLERRLRAFGCGIELTLLSAVPAGSGLGTSSILAATVLGALNDFCGLNWDKIQIGRRALALEQMLTTCGGWQDQFGGILQGAKLLTSERGFAQTITARYLPDELFTRPEFAACRLLYYTGMTRTAKSILAEIVRRMFLNHGGELALLREMKAHAVQMYEAILRADFNAAGTLVRKTWRQNCAIDAGTNPPEIQKITALIDDLCLGCKLAGAGGGGFLYIVAKDPTAATRIRQILGEARPNAAARFVNMSLSRNGLLVSRS